jgi:hypothetical protein
VAERRDEPLPLIHFAAEESKSPGGVILPATGSVRAWVKLKGEPAQIFVESPQETIDRWLDFKAHIRLPYTIFHEYNTGIATYFLRAALPELAYVAISYQTRPPERVRPGSWWLKQCPCEYCTERNRG